jgi:hypothetical protein
MIFVFRSTLDQSQDYSKGLFRTLAVGSHFPLIGESYQSLSTRVTSENKQSFGKRRGFDEPKACAHARAQFGQVIGFGNYVYDVGTISRDKPLEAIHPR